MVSKVLYDPSKHPIVIIGGMQWGDEAKGKMIATLSSNADLVARFNGGHNSGHNILLNDVEYNLHLLPSGSMFPNIKVVLGNGLVISLANLLKEVEFLKSRGVNIMDRLFISSRAQLLFDIHMELDCKQEMFHDIKGVAIGTTKTGIGPCYATKYLRTGIIVCLSTHIHTCLPSPPEVMTSVPLGVEPSSIYLSLKSRATPRDRGGVEGSLAVTSSGMKSSTGPQVEPVADLREAKGEVNRRADGRTDLGYSVGELLHWDQFVKRVYILMAQVTDDDPDRKAEEEIDKHAKLLNIFRHCIIDTSMFIDEAINSGNNVLLESANGFLLDINAGTYPYVTSSNTTTSAVYHGLCISPKHDIFRIGVLKSYQTRVGRGPFVTEVFGDIYEKLQVGGCEYGVTTKRKRRCGWLDLVSIRYSQRINGYDVLNLTKLDVLSLLDEIKICVDYKNKITGEIYPRGSFPPTVYDFENVEPLYKTFKGWCINIATITKFEQLPIEAQNYVSYIQEDLNLWIQWIGVGKGVNQTITRT